MSVDADDIGKTFLTLLIGTRATSTPSKELFCADCEIGTAMAKLGTLPTSWSKGLTYGLFVANGSS